MTLVERLKAIRAREGMTQAMFCRDLGMSISTYKKYEGGFTEMGVAPFLTIANHPRFKKYALWLTTGDSAPDSGQISPL